MRNLEKMTKMFKIIAHKMEMLKIKIDYLIII